MTYTIVEYLEGSNCHILKPDNGGNRIRVDLFVDSSFEDSPIKDEMTRKQVEDVCNGLIGKKVAIEDMWPYEYIATGVKLIDNSPIK